VPATCSCKCLAPSLGSRPVSFLPRAGEAVQKGDHNRRSGDGGKRVDQMLQEAANADVAFLVVGDPFG
jgi:hypothetical protein